MKKQVLNSLKLAALAVLISGCQSDKNDDYLPGVKPASGLNMTTMETSGFDAKEHMMLGKELKKRLEIVSATKSNNKYNLITFNAELKNIYSGSWDWLSGTDPYYIAYKVYWFVSADSEQRIPKTKWKVMQLSPGETFSVSATAPYNDCVDFMVKFKYIKENSPLFNALTGKAQPKVEAAPSPVIQTEDQPANYLAGDKKVKDSSTQPTIGQPAIAPQPVVAPEPGVIQTDQDRLTSDKLDSSNSGKNENKFVPAEDVIDEDKK